MGRKKPILIDENGSVDEYTDTYEDESRLKKKNEVQS